MYLFLLYSVRSPLYSVYILRYSHRKDMTNLHTQMSSNQSEKRTMFFTREKKNANHNREQCFFKGEKNGMSNQKPQRCVSFAPEFLLFISACSLQRPRFASCFAKTFNEKRKSEKRLGNWIGTVLYISLSTREDKTQSSLAIDNASVD